MTLLDFQPTALDGGVDASGAQSETSEPRAGDAATPGAAIKARAAAGAFTALAVGAALTPISPTASFPDDDTTTRSSGMRQPSADVRHELREAQRALALARFAPIRDALHDEGSQLVNRKHDLGLTAEEARRLDYVRWQIHMIEEAEVGPSLDALARLAAINEKLASTVQAIGRRVRGAPVTGRRGRR